MTFQDRPFPIGINVDLTRLILPVQPDAPYQIVHQANTEIISGLVGVLPEIKWTDALDHLRPTERRAWANVNSEPECSSICNSLLTPEGLNLQLRTTWTSAPGGGSTVA